MRESWERPMRLRAVYAFVAFLAATAVLTMLSCTPPARQPIYDLASRVDNAPPSGEDAGP